MQDMTTPEEETLRALDDLVRAGKVLYLGCSNYAAYRLTDSLWLSKSLGLERFVALQAQYSLVVRELEREHVPLCEKFGLGILPWSPLASGFLSGKYKKDAPPPAGLAAGQDEGAGARASTRRATGASLDALERGRQRARRDDDGGGAALARPEAGGHLGHHGRAYTWRSSTTT